MKTTIKISRVINAIALIFVLLGPYGIAFTGFLQVVAALIFLIVFPKNILIYIYFGIVGLFFLFWNGGLQTWFFVIPLGLIFYLTYLIHFSVKIKN